MVASITTLVLILPPNQAFSKTDRVPATITTTNPAPTRGLGSVPTIARRVVTDNGEPTDPQSLQVSCFMGSRADWNRKLGILAIRVRQRGLVVNPARSHQCSRTINRG